MLRTLLFLAVFLQAIIPVGFMPGMGTATMVICSGMGQKTIAVDENGQPVEDVQQSGCPYAPVLSLHTVAPPALPLSAIALYSDIKIPPTPIRAKSGIHPALPQGPPSIV